MTKVVAVPRMVKASRRGACKDGTIEHRIDLFRIRTAYCPAYYIPSKQSTMGDRYTFPATI
jgi:hypothetical protein